MTFKAHFDGRVLVPDERVDLPVGCPLEVQTTPIAEPGAKPTKPLEKLAALAAQFPENPSLPADGAAQHDHYLYGAPKRP